MNSFALNPPPPPLRVIKPRWPRLVRVSPAAFSLLIHAAFFIYFGATFFDKGNLQTRHGPISVHLLPAPVPTAVEPRKTLPPKPERPTQTKLASPKPIANVIKQTATPPPTPEEASIETPEEIAVSPTKTAAGIPVERATETQAETPPVTALPTQTLPAQERRQQAKQHYLAALMAHIESHKHYPHAARQRHMEGQTTVRFTLLASGEVSKINISGGPKLLRIASKTALQKALPLPVPPDTIDFPLPIQFNMEYQLI